ncbi:hypothetical protein AKO1_000971 [Acrasis kona]|uniref:Uncharacterized protein n=1 Tax=Acrasis kona TaxID=1008807 RepID=A0AAW2ZE49_9EUKA
MTNHQPESWTRDMAELLNHMNTLKNTNPIISVENSLEEEINPNYCMYQQTSQEQPWHAGFSFNKKQDSKSTENVLGPQIIYQEEEHHHHSPYGSYKMQVTSSNNHHHHHAASNSNLEQFIQQPTIHIQNSSTPDPDELEYSNEAFDIDPFDSFLNDFVNQDSCSLFEDTLFNMPSIINHPDQQHLTVEEPTHNRRNSFGNIEDSLSIPEIPHEQERAKSPKRTRRKSFGDLEGLENELEGIKRCRFDQQFQQVIANKSQQDTSSAPTTARRGHSLDENAIHQSSLENTSSSNTSSGTHGFEIRYQPVLMLDNVPVQVLDQRQLAPSLMITTSMGDNNRLSPHMGNYMQVSPQSPNMYSCSPVSPSTDDAYGMISNLMLNCDFQSRNGSVSPSGRKMVPVKRRNNKPSPADKYLSQFVMKQR